MKEGTSKLVSFGLSALVRYLREAKPLRTWVRNRRAKRGKRPLVNPAVLDSAADVGLAEVDATVEKRLRD